MGQIHITPDFDAGTTKDGHSYYCVHWYDKRGAWQASSRKLTKDEAKKEARRCRYILMKERKKPK